MKILFVCMSNICRSPYCEFAFRKIVEEDEVLSKKIEWVKSSAVFNKAFRMHFKSEKFLISEGFDKNYVRSHMPTFKWGKGRKFFNEADIIIGMTKSNKFFLPRKYHSKFALLSQLATGEYKPIHDPVLIAEQKKYNKIMEEIKGYLITYAEKLKAE